MGKWDLFLPLIDKLPKIRFQATDVGIVDHDFGKCRRAVHRKFQLSLIVMFKRPTDAWLKRSFLEKNPPMT